MMNRGYGPRLAPNRWGGAARFGPTYGIPGGYGGAPWGTSGFGSGFGPAFGGFGYGPAFGPSPATYPPGAPPSYFSPFVPTDAQLKSIVRRALDEDPGIPPNRDFGVRVQNGVVTLTGTAPSRPIKRAASADAWRIPAVVDVQNQIRLE